MNAKLTVKHDWIRVVATDAAKNRISLTASRHKESCSGRGVSMEELKVALTAFDRIIDKKTGQTVGDRMQTILELAQKATMINEYIKSLEKLADA